MTFSDDVVKDAWELAEGRCECVHPSHGHVGIRCNKKISLEYRGKTDWVGGWDASPINGNLEHNGLSNCQILCWNCFPK